VDDGLRWVAAPDGTVAFDVRRRVPGRGANTCAQARCVRQAASRGALSRTLKTDAHAGDPEALIESAQVGLDRQVRELLGLLRRSGVLEIGAKPVKQGLRTANYSLIVVAHDHSERSAADLVGEAATVRWGTSDGIGRAIGRKPTGVVAAPVGALTDALTSVVRKSNTLAGAVPVDKGISS
jgi:hypothetical protein